jgi:hypothetical protein
MQIVTLPGETLGCAKPSDTLVVARDHAACVDAAAACGPGSRMNGRACAPERACPPGEVASTHGVCTRVVFAGENGPIVDVAEWSRQVFGPDGGYGSSFLCGPLALEPWALTTMTDVRLTVALDIELAFPDNDVTQAHARVQGHDAVTGQPIVGLDAVENVVKPLLSSLRALGGTARSAGVSSHVRCVLPLGPRPVAAPRDLAIRPGED